MIQNRYKDGLRENNQTIIDLSPANYTLRIELSLEMKKRIIDKPTSKILEIGSGECDLTKYILQNNKFSEIDCLDVAQEMIDAAKPIMKEYRERIHFMCEDALTYLENTEKKYDIITSAWTLHNFTQENRKRVFENIYANLTNNGKLIILDKIYPDVDEEEKKRLLYIQLSRYRYLEVIIATNIIAHEHQDYLEDYRMDESDTINILKKI
ncbi:MAG: class I SAM-dependent methyltransferase [bacterium]